jgi:hypothetical protein
VDHKAVRDAESWPPMKALSHTLKSGQLLKLDTQRRSVDDGVFRILNALTLLPLAEGRSEDNKFNHYCLFGTSI